MKTILLLTSTILLSFSYNQSVYCADSLQEWKPPIRTSSTSILIIKKEVLQFHFNIPAENNFIQIYDQSGQLIFEDCFSTLSSTDYQVSLADFSAGSYIVYYSDGESKISELFIIDE